MTCIIFDIDGTLVRSYNFEGECFKQAIRCTIGDVYIRKDWGEYNNVTDEGILREIYADNSQIFTNSTKIRSIFGHLVDLYLDKNPSACDETPGARLLLQKLYKETNVRLGLATGGWRHTARAKLNHARITHDHIPFFSSDDGVSRIEIMEKCRASLGKSFDETIYVGDGEWDMRATKALGWKFIGVGPRLKDKCSTWISDFNSVNFQDLIEPPATQLKTKEKDV